MAEEKSKKVKKNTTKSKKKTKKKTTTELAIKTTTKSTTKKKPNNTNTKKGSGKKPKKSATIQSIERQQRLEQTMPLGAFTTELPSFKRALDAPSRNPFKERAINKRIERRKQRSEYHEFDPREHIGLFVFLGILVALAIAILVVTTVYSVDTVIIEGNVHYTNDEIYNFVIGDGRLNHNSFYLAMKYKDKEIQDIPFIQTMNVKIVNSSTVKITVYEKAVAGFVEHMGKYFYFDKDGTVIESSNTKTKGIPQVMGLNYDHIVLYEKLPLENDDIFREILEMTQLLDKYEIEMDKIYFDSRYNMTLYFGDSRIKVGNFDNIDEKIIKLKTILPELEGKKGVLRLDSYDGSDSIITFEVDE